MKPHPPPPTTPPKPSTHTTLSIFGTISMTLALLTLYASLLTVEWLTLYEPTHDPTELEKLSPYDSDPKPHLLKAKLGLFKTCILYKQEKSCIGMDWRRLVENGELFEGGSGQYQKSELVLACVNRVRLTLPFILSSVLFTSLAFFTLIFGTFCNKNRKIYEASLLILAGLCQATALLTFVSQIGSEFESNNSYSLTTPTAISSHYRYKYGYSFYLFLLSFSLSELAALFTMASYFKKSRTTPPGPQEQQHQETYGMESLDYSKHPDICEMNDYIIPEISYNHVVPVGYYTAGRGVKGGLNNLESFATMGRTGQMNRL